MRVVIGLCCLLFAPWVLAESPAATAELNADLAAEAFLRSNRVMHAWLARTDEVTGLLPRTGSDPNWVIKDSAADLYPFLILASYFTDRDLFAADMRRILRQESILAKRVGTLPDDLQPGGRGFVRDTVELDRVLFGSSEYAKDGLLAVTELLGETAWYYRLLRIASGIIENSPVQTARGRIPATSAEVNGNMLQVLTRLHWRTSRQEYFVQAQSIADNYMLDILPKTNYLPPDFWDFQRSEPLESSFRFSDHGNEIVGGLTEFYALLVNRYPEKAKQYRAPFTRMINRLLEVGPNQDGVWRTRVDLSGKILDERHVHCWGYLYTAIYAAYMATGEETYREAVSRVMKGATLNPRYLFDEEGAGRGWGANAYSDSIEGAINLLNRVPDRLFADEIDRAIRKMFDRQREDGIVEDWYGDGNFIRTALMYAFWKTQGSFLVPWRPSVKLGAAPEKDRLLVYISASEPWEGRLCFDHPRHRDHWNMSQNYPRLNEFPEWYAVEPSQIFVVQINGGPPRRYLGSDLLDGLALNLSSGEKVLVEVSVGSETPSR